MSPYLAGAIGIAFLAWSGAMYYEGKTSETHICGEADAKHDLAQTQGTVAAQQHVIGTIQQQNSINEGISHAYQIGIFAIDDLYSTASVQPAPIATGNDLRTIPGTSTGTRPIVCAQTSRKYKLTPKQCDMEEEGYNQLWNAWNAQAALK